MTIDEHPSDQPAIAGGTPVRAQDNFLVFGAPVLGEAEETAVLACLRSRWIGQGQRVLEFEQKFARYTGAPYAVAVNSATAALNLALLAFGVGPGDEVLVPTMTFCSTVNSIVHTGAQPVLVDCDPRTFLIDPDQIEARITPRTKALVVVHMCGRCCAMDRIMELARKHNLRVIEDCAHAIESRYQGIPAGRWGDAGCFSFYATKNVTTGDGGMVITSSRRWAKRIKLLSLHGMTSDAWHRTTAPRAGYDVLYPGYKCNMTDLEASLGLVQLQYVEERAVRRAQLWDFYQRNLEGLPLVLPPAVEEGTRHAFHLYSVLLQLEQLRIGRAELMQGLRAEGIGSGVHYVPVHMLRYYRCQFGFRPSDFPHAKFVGERTLSLPLTASMEIGDAADVCRAIGRLLRYHFVKATNRASRD